MMVEEFIAEQPDVLEDVLADVPQQIAALEAMQVTRPVYLVGSGSSLNALLAVGPLFMRILPPGVRILGPLAFLDEAESGRRRKGTAVFLSQTGTSVTTVDAVRWAHANAWRAVTLTTERDSPIGAASGDVIVMPVGREPVGPKTKGYTASVLSLILLARWIAGQRADPGEFTSELSRLISYARGAVIELAETCEGSDFLMVMGQERHYATASEASLKLSEMSGIPAAPFDTEEAFHGRFNGLGMFSVALFIAATPVQHDMATTGATVLSELGIRARILNLAASLPGPHDLPLPWPVTDGLPELDLISAIVPFQLLACELARRKGVPPGRMRYPDLPQRLRLTTGLKKR
jgi:fructoselysine-6-P-deglycase FrlB-like protein